jgi:predicted ribosomally synthesized peptide with nif11-like leader
MAKEAIVEFLNALDEQNDIRTELASALEEKEEQAPVVVEVAARHGFQFTEDELNVVLELAAAEQDRGLSDAELDSVAGGAGRTGPPPPAGIRQYHNIAMKFSGRFAQILIR